jgi:hypothetical protein
MAIDTNVQTFTNAQMLSFVRLAIAQVLVGGQSYAMPGGKQFTRADLKALQAMEDQYLAASSADAGDGGIALARFGDAV